ncbi:amidohydrolase family protein [Pseudochelatococcus sp. B33]
MLIDVHGHALSERFIRDLTRKPISGLTCDIADDGAVTVRHPGDDRNKSTLDPHLFDMPHRLDSLRRRKVEKQFFAPQPFLLAWNGSAADVELSRALNRQSMDVQEAGDGLLEAMAVLALGEPERAADELQRAVDEYGMRSAMIPSTAGGVPLDEAQFTPLFSAVERLGVMLFMHPTAMHSPRYGHYLNHVLVGFPHETTLAVTRMIFEGFFERHPGIKLILAHGGGDLAFLSGRLDSAYLASGWEADPYCRRHISKPPSAYLRDLYYDTCTLSEDSNRFLVAKMGAERIVFGTDYPFDIGDPEGMRTVPVLDELPSDQREMISRSNVLTLLAR